MQRRQEALLNFLVMVDYRFTAVDAYRQCLRRFGAATALVANAETFARSHGMRGIYVDTPVNNLGGRRFYEALGYDFGYLMPRYYEDLLDGVTYQKFFEIHPLN